MPTPRLPSAITTSPWGKTGICGIAVSLIGIASANVAIAMYGLPLDAPRWLATLMGYGAGTYLIYLGHCHSLLHGRGGA